MSISLFFLRHLTNAGCRNKLSCLSELKAKRATLEQKRKEVETWKQEQQHLENEKTQLKAQVEDIEFEKKRTM